MALRLVPDVRNLIFLNRYSVLRQRCTIQFLTNRVRHTIMPIRPFLAGQAFEPELIRQMSLALETVCAKLALPLTDEPATRLIASKIIELAQRRVKDAATLSTMTLKEFKHY
jgi:hypothetical protein